MFKKTAIILATLALSVGSALATPVVNYCGNTPSTGVLSASQVLCGGDKSFSNFSIIEKSSGLNVTSDVSAAIFVNGTTVDIEFTTGWSVASGIQDYSLRFQVNVLADDWFITAIGQGVTGYAGNPNASVKLDEVVWSNGFVSGAKIGNSTVTWLGDELDEPGEFPGEFGDVLYLTVPDDEIFITKDIRLDAGTLNSERCQNPNLPTCSLGASATTITQRFYQTPGGDLTDVPEPATMLLFSTALLGLGFMRRKKS